MKPTVCLTRLRAIAFTVLWVGTAALAPPAAAQKVRIQVARGPHYVGEQVDIDIVAEGFEEDPQPEIRPPQPTLGHLTFHGVSPQVSSSITIVNGQMARSRRVAFTYHFRFIADEPGRAELLSFVLEQNGVTRSTAPVALRLREIASSNAVAVQMRLPEGPLFVGQKLKIAIDFLIERDLQRNLVSYALRVPLFESSQYRFLDEPSANAKTELQVQTHSGTLMLAGTYREVDREGRKYLLFTAERTMIPLEAGTFEPPPPSVIVNQGTNYRRDLFGGRQATAVRKLMARGQPTTVEVIEVPVEERPPSFGGAIGRGYTLDVTADRSVVQVGEPIVLSFHLRGDGDLTTASLPGLDRKGLLDPNEFRVPTDSPPGRIDESGKHFDVTVRVLDASVREIPALSYSWFDAGTRRFETVRSRPIALSVGAAQVIGANAVERRAQTDTKTEASPDEAEKGSRGLVRSASLALSGADLAVERNRALLLRDDRAGGTGLVPLAGLYGLGAASIALAVLDRRRRDVDPRVLKRRKALARARRELETALGLPGQEAAVAGALRAMLSEVPEAGGQPLDVLLGECDARSYAPADSQIAPLPDELRLRAREIAKALEEAGQ